MKIIYDEIDFKDFDEEGIIFDELFNNSYEQKKYIITGDIGLWDGVRKNVHNPSVFNSLKDAILTANDGFYGYITVSEGSYGKLLVDISHHDGHNSLEIKELSKIGEQMYNENKSVCEILKRKDATRNVKFLKNYR